MLQSKLDLDDKARAISSKHKLLSTTCMIGATASTSWHTAIARDKLHTALGAAQMQIYKHQVKSRAVLVG